MTLAEIQAAVDAKLATLWSLVQTRENTYAATHGGRYWQGLRSHTIDPADGVEVLPDVGTKTPTDQPSPWPVAWLTTAIPMSLQIDVYDGPLGVGYVGTVRVTVLGQTWTRAAQVGPETNRVQGWTQIPASIVP